MVSEDHKLYNEGMAAMEKQVISPAPFRRL